MNHILEKRATRISENAAMKRIRKKELRVTNRYTSDDRGACAYPPRWLPESKRTVPKLIKYSAACKKANKIK